MVSINFTLVSLVRSLRIGLIAMIYYFDILICVNMRSASREPKSDLGPDQAWAAARLKSFVNPPPVAPISLLMKF